jgi:hypothetical protein
MREVMQRAGQHPGLAAHRGEIAAYVQRISPRIKGDPPLPEVPIDEMNTLEAAEGYLAKRFQLSQVAVHREEDAAGVDPMNRRGRARPGRPAFYFPGVVGRGGTR